MSNGEVTEISVEEAAARFIATLPVAKQEGYQQEVKQFILWYGRTCLISRLSVTQVDDYTEWVAQSTVEPQKRLEPVRAFLNYARKEGLITTNLAQHVKAKKSVSKSAVMGKAAVSADQSILTAEGKAELEKEMVHLKSESVKASQAILIAAADKDFRENAPLEAARELHGRIMGRLRDVETALASSSVACEQAAQKAKVIIGSKVSVIDLATSEKVTYTLVSPSEVKPLDRKISMVSPLGKALLDHQTGDTVDVQAPMGTLRYRIECVEN